MRWVIHKKDKREWHKWFAWYPINVKFLKYAELSIYVWLSTIERKQVNKHWLFRGYYYEYREIEKEEIGI